MALKDLGVSDGGERMEHVCSLCRGKMKKLKTTGNIHQCEKCNHIEYVS